MLEKYTSWGSFPVMLTRRLPMTYEFKELRLRPRTFLIKDKGKATIKLEYESRTIHSMIHAIKLSQKL